MIRSILLLLIVLFAPPAEAQDSTQTDGRVQPGEPISDKNPFPDKEPESAWPLPFNPSQEISADSPVSFPTDI